MSCPTWDDLVKKKKKEGLQLRSQLNFTLDCSKDVKESQAFDKGTFNKYFGSHIKKYLLDSEINKFSCGWIKIPANSFITEKEWIDIEIVSVWSETYCLTEAFFVWRYSSEHILRKFSQARKLTTSSLSFATFRKKENQTKKLETHFKKKLNLFLPDVLLQIVLEYLPPLTLKLQILVFFVRPISLHIRYGKLGKRTRFKKKRFFSLEIV